MANTILLKKNGTASVVPTSLSFGELALNYADGKLYYKHADTTIKTLGGTGTVTSISATVPSFLTVTGSPVTASGTLAISYSGTALPVANGGTGLISHTANGIVYASDANTLATSSGLTFDGTSLKVGRLITTAAATTNPIVIGRADSSVPTSIASVSIGYNIGLIGNYSVSLGFEAGRYGNGADNFVVGQSAGQGGATGNTYSNSIIIGSSAGFKLADGSENIYLGPLAGLMNISGWYNICIGAQAGRNATGDGNSFLGNLAGKNVTTGSNNTIVGRFDGNQLGLNISTLSNYIVLSDGTGNPRLYSDNVGNINIPNLTASSPVFTDASKNLTNTGTVSVAKGGTGASTLASNNVLLGNGTGALQTVAPGVAGNVLTSNGTTWSSTASAGGGITYTKYTTNVTAVDKQGIIADTSSGQFTVTLPATPATGAQVVIVDGGNWSVNNLTIARNGSTIENIAEDMVVDIGGVAITLIYDGTTWEVFSQVGAAGGNAITNVSGTAPIVSSGGTAPVISISAATTSAAGSMSSVDKTKLDGIATGATANTGTVTSVSATVPSFLSISGSPVTGSGTLAFTYSGTALPVVNGGTGTTTLASNNVLLGNGTGALQVVAPGTSGNVLTSNGTTWSSTASAGGGITYTKYTTNVTAVDKQGIIADTSSGQFTVTLPETPATGAQVVIVDGANWSVNNLIVARNLSTIEGLAEDMALDIGGASITFIYDGTTWEVFSQIGAAGGTAGFRNVPPVGTKSSSYTLTISDVGKYVQITTGGSVTIPDAVFAEGDVVSVFNNTSGTITITCSITAAYISGTDVDKATVSLSTRGIATIFFISGTVCVISGSVS